MCKSNLPVFPCWFLVSSLLVSCWFLVAFLFARSAIQHKYCVFYYVFTTIKKHGPETTLRGTLRSKLTRFGVQNERIFARPSPGIAAALPKRLKYRSTGHPQRWYRSTPKMNPFWTWTVSRISFITWSRKRLKQCKKYRFLFAIGNLVNKIWTWFGHDLNMIWTWSEHVLPGKLVFEYL